jgi:PAS domain S-box-containing protein
MFVNLTIRQKLTILIMLTSIVVIVFSSTIIFIFELQSHRSQAADNLESVAKLIGHNCQVALSFNIPEDAEKMLLALSAKPSVVLAVVYDADNNVFATYTPFEPQGTQMIHEDRNEGTSFIGQYLEAFYHIRFNDSVIGSICLRSDMRDFRRDLTFDLGVMGVILVIALFITYFLATKLQGLISKPIFSLVNTVKQVSVRKDYSVRALKHSEDEIGKLTDAFNNMLFQIERSNKAITQSEEKHRRLIENLTGSFVFTHNTDNQFAYVSPSVTDVLGYSAEEFLSDFMEYLTEHPINQDVHKHKDLTVQGIQQPSYEIQLYHKNGGVRWLEVSEVPVRDEIGLVIAVEGIAHDITDRKKSEEERERLLKALSLKNAELENIVYVSSHDLRSPLINMQCFADELTKSCKQAKALFSEMQLSGKDTNQLMYILEEDIPSSLEFINSSVKILDALQKGLLRICRLGYADLQIEHLDINNMLSSIIKNMQYQIEKQQITVNINTVPPCFGDKGQIYQVFTNLLDNAIKYLDLNRKGLINVSGKTEEGFSVYCVEDNGIGIRPEYYDKIFEIFHRLDPKGAITGEGLGLSVVRRIIERHNGNIWLESEPDKGCRFFVSLPSSADQISPNIKFTGETL